MPGLAYGGSGPIALGLCCDKALLRAVAMTHRVPVPDEVFLRPGDVLPDSYPAFVRPNRGDGSLGVTEATIVADAQAARMCVDAVREEFPGCDLLLHEYLSGTEYGFGLIGNEHTGFTALPMPEVNYDKLPPKLPRFLIYASKADPQSRYWNDIGFRSAGLDRAGCLTGARTCTTACIGPFHAAAHTAKAAGTAATPAGLRGIRGPLDFGH